jgi:superfamily I DNA and RNA helicase
LVYVEVKSSPPKGVELSEISNFFSRIEDLQPDIAFLFNDTQLRMKDKLVVMFEEELERRYGNESAVLYPVRRLIEELFQVRSRIFIVNSSKDAVEISRSASALPSTNLSVKSKAHRKTAPKIDTLQERGTSGKIEVNETREPRRAI